MATHPSFLAWRIPWTEDPGGLQSAESDTTEQLTHTHTHTHTHAKRITFIENLYFYCYYISPTSDRLGDRGALMQMVCVWLFFILAGVFELRAGCEFGGEVSPESLFQAQCPSQPYRLCATGCEPHSTFSHRVLVGS